MNKKLIEVNNLYDNAVVQFTSLKQACHFIATRPALEREDWMMSTAGWNLDGMRYYEKEEQYYKRMYEMMRAL